MQRDQCNSHAINSRSSASLFTALATSRREATEGEQRKVFPAAPRNRSGLAATRDA